MAVKGPNAVTQIVVASSSTGGIEALCGIVKALPRNLPAPVVIAQHLDPRVKGSLSDILAKHSALPVRVVDDKESLRAGVVYVVPNPRTLRVSDRMVVVKKSADELKPSVEQLRMSTRHLSGKLKRALKGTYGPLPAGVEDAFERAILSLDRISEVLGDAALQADLIGAQRDRIDLSPRELDILRLMCAGYRNNDIASKLNYSVGTIKAHVRTILEKLQAADRTEAAVIAVKRGLI